jgi:hypothetical protein
MQYCGLGFRNLINFNQALLGEWSWRYTIEREALWCLVLDAKYDSLSGGWCSKVVEGHFASGV